jgi:hypothetical protein
MPKPDSRAQASSHTDAKRPVHTLRHRRIQAAIWRNETDKGPMYNVTITRSYKKDDGDQWQESHSFGYDDLMNVSALMYEAHAFISSLLAKDSQTRDSRR